jgi:DNA polymerase eta
VDATAADYKADVDATPPEERNRHEISWKCPRCGDVFKLPSRTADGSGAVEASDRLDGLKQEHEDYHFARDLHLEERSVQAEQSSSGADGAASRQTGRRKKSTGKSEGIKAFFNAKPKN